MQSSNLKSRKNGDARLFWNESSEVILIDVWRENLFECEGLRKNSHIYKDIVERLKEAGCTVDTKDVKNKIDNLTKKYRKETKKQYFSDKNGSVWKHYPKLHNIFDGPQSINPSEVITRSAEKGAISPVFKPEDDSWIKYNAMNICGQLLISSDRSSNALKCNFCEIICLRLEDFENHMEKHKAEIIDEQFYAYEDALQFIKDDEAKRQNDKDDCRLESDHALTGKTNPERTDLVEENQLGGAIDPMLEVIDLKTVDNSIKLGRVFTDLLDLYDEANRDVILGIIAALKTNTSQWNPEDVRFWKHGLGRNNMSSLTKIMEDKCNAHFTKEIFQKTCYEMFRLYYKECCRLNDIDLRTKPKPELWFFENINFINKLENKSKLIVSENMMVMIAKEYAEHAPLWDLTNVTYHDIKLKERTFETMFREINKVLGSKLTVRQLKERIRKLRMYSIANKRTRIRSERNGEKFDPPYPMYLDATSFLNEYIRPFFCSECHETVECYGGYVEHMSKHNNGNYYVCNYCGKNHISAINLKVHLRTHTQELPFECSTCGKKFTNSSSKKKHERIHSGVRSAICDTCGKAFYSDSQLADHIKGHQPGLRVYTVKCEMCSKSFCSKSVLRQHMNSHFNRREFVCEHCGKGFFARKTLRQHEGLHSTVKKYSCEICSKTFAQFAGKHIHKRIAHRRLPLATDDQKDLVEITHK